MLKISTQKGIDTTVKIYLEKQHYLPVRSNLIKKNPSKKTQPE